VDAGKNFVISSRIKRLGQNFKKPLKIRTNQSDRVSPAAPELRFHASGIRATSAQTSVGRFLRVFFAQAADKPHCPDKRYADAARKGCFSQAFNINACGVSSGASSPAGVSVYFRSWLSGLLGFFSI